MALIDVSSVLLDPDFFDPVILIHRRPTVDLFGQNMLQEIPLNTTGTVQPASGKAIERLPDALRVGDIKSFWIQGTIVSDGRCAYPDIIVFRGSRFAVQMVFDWLNYGNGYSEGVCIREAITV